MHVAFTDSINFTNRAMRAVPIYFRVETVHTDAPKDTIYKELSAEAQRFLVGVDFTKLSQNFQ